MPTPRSPPHLFLLTSMITILLSTTTAATTTPPPSSDVISQILSQLGFRELASAAHNLSSTIPIPITIFAPTDSSLLTCPSCSLPLLLQEHSLPGLYPSPFLLSLPFATKIHSLSPLPRCLTITNNNHNNNHHNHNNKLFVNGVEITKPDLYSDQNLIVHAIQGFLSHLSPLSCTIERTTSLSFPPAPPNASSFHLMASMLDDVTLRLRISGFSVLALALKLRRSELLELRSMTVFAVDDVGIFAEDDGNSSYVKDLRMHVVPDRRLTWEEMEGMEAGTEVETMEWGETLVVTKAGGGGELEPMRINYVKIARPDLVTNLKVVVHGLAVPFERVNLTEAVRLARIIGRCGFHGVCDKVGPVGGNNGS